MSAKAGSVAINLGESPIHLNTSSEAEGPVQVLENFGFDQESFEQYLAEHCQDGPGRILMIETSHSDWPNWECHTEGDEVVVILEGSGVIIQHAGNEEKHIPVCAGQAVINPRSVWHTANIEEPMRALYITPCRGTQHKAR